MTCIERPALLAREHRRVELLRDSSVACEDHAAARAGERLVRRRRRHVCVRHGVRVQPGRDQAAEVRHVDQEQGAHLVRDAAERGEVELARVRRPAGDDHLGPGLEGRLADGVHVDPHGLGVHAVGGHLVELAAEIEPHAVGQVAAVRELEAEDALARLEEGDHRCRVRLGTAVRLHVRIRGAEEGLDPLAREILRDVDELAPAVVAPAGVALGVLVGQHRTLGLEHGAGGEVLARDHLERAALAAQLPGEHGGQLGVDLFQRGRGDRLGGRGGSGRLVEHRHSWHGSGGTAGPRAQANDPREDIHRSPVVTHPNASRGGASLPSVGSPQG